MQPTLSENGTLGGNEFAVWGTPTPSTSYPVWHAFNGNITANGANSWCITSSGTVQATLVVYNPDPLCVSQIRINNYAYADDRNIQEYTIGYSDNNISYTQFLGPVTNTHLTKQEEWYMLVNATSYHKYWRIDFTTWGNGNGYGGVTEFTFAGTIRMGTIATPESITTKMLIKY